MKRIISAVLTGLMLSSVIPASAAEGGIKVLIDGKNIEFDVPPMIIENRTMVPLRKIFEELGAIVEYEPTERMITAVKDETEIVLFVDRNDMYVDQQEITLDVPAIIVDSRTLVPVRAVSEAFACEVKWQADISSVVISSPGNETGAASGELSIDFSNDTNGVKRELHENMRYNFEQYALPAMLKNADAGLTDSFINDPDAFVKAIDNGPWTETMTAAIVNQLMTDENSNEAEDTAELNSPIAKKADEFELHAYQGYAAEACLIGDKYAMILEMADIDAMLISTYIAIVYDEANGFSYYMLEKSMGDMYMLCSRQGENHVNMGIAENTKESFINAVKVRLSAE